MGCFFDSGPDFGTRLDVGDDDSQLVNFTMGFTFSFYGIVHNSVFVNSNGNLTFNTASSEFTPTFPDFINGPPRIAPYWIDLDTTCLPPTNGVFVKQFPDRLIVTYLRDAYFSCPANPQINTFQVVLFNTGLIRFAYCTLDNTFPAGDANPSFPLVGVASGYGGPSSIFRYNPPANFDPQQTVVGPPGFLDENNEYLDWQFNGNNYDLLLHPCLPFSDSCPANITQVNDTRQSGAIVNYTDPTVTGACPDVTVSCTPASGSFFPIGDTQVTCTATDTTGNTTECTFIVRVITDPCRLLS
ncbi:MAG: HYR domain-containing protein [Halobacillus sp.]|uniref:HYR domain-containing protein n=1 Tax=Halobacillus sp. TaxID=56800 RepID=UPI003BB067FA